MRMHITPSDVKRSKIIKPGWYHFKINKVVDEPSKAGDSVNTVVDVEGLEGDAAGVPIKIWFSEKAPSFAIPFIKANGGSVSEETGSDYDMATAQGNVVRCKVETQPGLNGRPQNMIADWAPSTGGAGSATKAPEPDIDIA
jgi:hypothetical protein